MKNVMNSPTKKSIDMSIYGITTLVVTTQKEIDEILNEFVCNPRNVPQWHSEKLGLLNYLKFVLMHEDKYFNALIKVNRWDEKRWADFTCDCVVYACLHSHMNGLEVPAKDSFGLEAEVKSAIDLIEESERKNYSLYKRTGTDG